MAATATRASVSQTIATATLSDTTRHPDTRRHDMSNGDERIESGRMDAYELGRLDGKAQQPRTELIFSKLNDSKSYNKGWYDGYKESIN